MNEGENERNKQIINQVQASIETSTHNKFGSINTKTKTSVLLR